MRNIIKCNKFKILFLGHLPPPSTGEGNVILTYFQVLPQYGFELKLLDTGLRNKNITPNSFNGYNLLRAIKHLFKLIFLLIKWQPNVVNINVASRFATIKSLFYFGLCKIFKIRTIAHLHAGWLIQEYPHYKRFIKNLLKKLFKIPDIWIAPGRIWKNYIVSLGVKNDNVFILYNSIKKDIFDIMPKRKKFNKYINFIYIGDIITRKGLDIISEVFSNLIKEGYHTHINIVGLSQNPNSEEKLLLDIFKKKINKNFFTFFYALEGSEYLRKLKQSDILVIASRSENLPISMLEAMSQGLVIVSSNVGAIPEVIKDGYNGLLFNSDCPEKLFSILKKILDGKINLEKISKHEVDTIKMNHSLYRNGKEMADIINNLIGKK